MDAIMQFAYTVTVGLSRTDLRPTYMQLKDI